jgi:peptidoglycan/LPS O-acetylase OafA/YrhL
VLGVVLVHTSQRVVRLPAGLAAITTFGGYGVHLFFVASAFTLFSSLSQRSPSEDRPILYYAVRRIFRIAPMFWLAVLFYVWWYGLGPRYWAPHGLRWLDVLATAGFVHGWSPTTINSVVPGGWSIAVEMNFYLLVPVLFTWLTNLRRCVWFFISCVAGQAVLNMATQPTFVRVLAPDEQYLAVHMHTLWLPSQLPVFAAGFVLYYALAPRLRRQPGESDPTWQMESVSPVLWLLLAASVLAQRWMEPASMFWGSVLAVLVFVLALHPSRLLVNAFTRYVGEISYSGYLVHFVVLEIADRVLHHFTTIARFPLVYLPVLYVAAVIGTILLATITNRLLESPARAVGRSLIAELQRRHGALVLIHPQRG